MARRYSSAALLTVLLILIAFPAAASDFSPAKVSKGDWAKYLVTTDNRSQAMLSTKDQPEWIVVNGTHVGRDNQIARLKTIKMLGAQKSSFNGVLEMDKPYEPLFHGGEPLLKIASTSDEPVTLKGRTYACKKIVRKMDKPDDPEIGAGAWKGTSTIWLSGEVPLGLVKMVNDYEMNMGMPMKVVETWVLDESGFKNWKGDD